MNLLPRFTFGMGDRFGHQGQAQLEAIIAAQADGIEVAPVWNKSLREHSLIGTEPESLRAEADAAIRALEYQGPYFVDADHINFDTVDGFIDCSNFFTLDVAEQLGRRPVSAKKGETYTQALEAISGYKTQTLAVSFSASDIDQLVNAYGGAVEAAAKIYGKLVAHKDPDSFAIEVSMDETDEAQGPKELLGILAMLASEKLPVQTIAPKFTGRFNKGVDYVGDLEQFQKEFEDDLKVLAYAVENFGLPSSLKLSVHSGSDKFSLYPIIRELVEKSNAGLHIKTAGTTWLEEVIGLAEAGGEALEFVKQLYIQALQKVEELTAPYATVLDIDPAQLPDREQALNWTSESVVAMVAHEPENPAFNSSLRQFFHVAFKLAAKEGETFHRLLKENSAIINKRVYENLLEKHMRHIFPRNS